MKSGRSGAGTALNVQAGNREKVFRRRKSRKAENGFKRSPDPKFHMSFPAARQRLKRWQMRRLLLTFLIVCLALPAVAVEACAPPVPPPQDVAMHGMTAHDMAAHGHHAPSESGDEQPSPGASAQHGCIGCVPPLAVPAMVAAAPFISGPFASEPLTPDLVAPYGPTPPPPRRAA